MMKTTIATSAAALLMLSGAAVAEPTVMSDEQMDNLVAGQTPIAYVETMNGNIVLTVFSLDPTGQNNGGNGNTAKTAPGLLNAADQSGLNLGRPGKGKGLVLNLLPTD